LRDSVKYAPTKGRYKVYIIDEVHMLTKESFNAFLKTLEEPPSHTIFIFATTDVHKVPLTIISRCQRFDFRRIQLETIKSLLQKIAFEEGIKIDDKTLTIIGKKADGALRDAESYFDQIVSFCGNKIDSETVAKMLNLIDDEVYFNISDAVLNKNYKTVFEVSNKIYENGWDFTDFISGLIEHFRNIMTVVLTERTELIETAEVYRNKYLQYSDRFSEGDILRLLNFLNKAQQELRFTQNHKLKVEITLSHLISLEKSETISRLITEINNKDNAGTSTQPLFLKENIKYVVDPPAKKNELPEKETSKLDFQEKKKAAPNNPVFNFEDVLAKWESFVNDISSERALIFGPVLKNIKPVNLEGNKLQINCKDSHQKNILQTNESYLTKKTSEFFGKRLLFQFNENDDNSLPVKEMQDIRKDKKEKLIEDPYINLIINELGGEEVK
jgi:DNA polymerase-3 subunit gamma/tau